MARPRSGNSKIAAPDCDHDAAGGHRRFLARWRFVRYPRAIEHRRRDAKFTSGDRTTVAVCWALAGGSILYAAVVGWYKYFTTDEFQYAHAAWLIARGSVPYRDFFDHHFPLLYQALAPAYWFLPDEPTTIRLLRLFMLPVLGALALAGSAVNRDWGAYAAPLVVPFMFITRVFAYRATEIRPDVLSTALFLTGLAIVWHRGATDRARLRGVALGLAVGLAVWASQKAVYYVGPLCVLLLADWLLKWRRGRRDFLGGSFLAFAAGAGGVAAAAAAYLVATDSWREWFRWCIEWSFIHQTYYPYSVSRWPMLANFFSAIWLLPLALLGLVWSMRSPAADRIRELILIAALGSTAASYLLQKAPYEYSLIPFLAIVAIYAARGADGLLRLKESRRWRAMAAGLLVAMVAASAPGLWIAPADRNDYQLWLLDKIGAFTAADDAVYDNSGSAVTRPHVGYFFYTDSLLRNVYRKELATSVPAHIVQAEAKLWIVNAARHATLPPPLLHFLYRHFQPYNGDLRVWGQRYVPGAPQDTFLAVATGRYFVDPPEVAVSGSLRIGSRSITTPEFELQKGAHPVAYDGPPVEFTIIWLPRNGERFTPRRDAMAAFSPLL